MATETLKTLNKSQLRRQNLIDEAIKLANDQGKKDLAEEIASLGGASESVIEQEILPILEERINNLNKLFDVRFACCDEYLKISSLISTLASYSIHPFELIDKAIFLFLDNKFYRYALFLAKNGSEKAKKAAIDAAFEKGLGDLGTLKEIISLKNEKELGLEDLIILLASLKKEGYQMTLLKK